VERVDDKRKGKKHKYTTVSIPTTLYERIKKLINGTGYTSVSDYVVHVLREVVAMHEEEKFEEPFTKEDVERIKRKLKALGYL
jgi:Arc/MetJ-type ribon-helix-helix transcriptional regulator